MIQFFKHLNFDLFFWINTKQTTPFLDDLMTGVTHLSHWIIVILVVSIILVWLNPKKSLLVLVLIGIGIFLSDQISSTLLKNIFQTPRPCDAELPIAGGRFLLGLKRNYSFPSSHAANMFVFAMVFGYFYRWAWPVVFALALLVCYSRIYVGVHYPIDVVGGMILGGLIGWGIIGLYRRYQKPLDRFINYTGAWLAEKRRRRLERKRPG